MIKLQCEEQVNRLDSWLSAMSGGLSRNAVQRLCEQGMVLLNGKPANKKSSLKPGDIIEYEEPEPVESKIVPVDIPLDIVYEDKDLLVVNKPKGMVVHPAPGHYDDTLVHALLAHCHDSLSGIGGIIRPGIVHRIDKDTSGLLMVAKNDETHIGLAKQIKEHSFIREYEAVVIGNVRDEEGTIDAPIGRHPVERKKMAITDKNSRNAVTHYKVIARYDGYTHLRLRLETGRTHQIRVHMAYIGHPVAGDVLYGGKKLKHLEGQCLHAKHLEFEHPVTGEWLGFEAPLPDYFTSFLNTLRNR